MLDQKLIDKKEFQLLTEHLDEPRLSIFYGLPKIHKTFSDFPPLRPIVSAYNSCTSRLSEYLDSFLKFQAKRCKSYIGDTKEFLNKLNNIKTCPDNSILVTMDILSLYTNIDHEEGATACFEVLEKRKNKKIPSLLLKRLILTVLKSNVFRFGDKIYQQIMGTAMGTPMAPNYANIFLDRFESHMLDEYEVATGLKPLVWMRFIDDIFFIWQHDKVSLDHFVKFCNDYSKSKNMKSRIKFETNISIDTVNFLDVTVGLENNVLTTSVYTKPTDAHLYLNSNSCHTPHIIKNIPKGQFVRIRRICSDYNDFLQKSETAKGFFISRGYKEQHLRNIINEVKLLTRDDLLKGKEKTSAKDPQSIMVCTWHPKLRMLPSILHKNYDIIKNDVHLSRIFTARPSVAFRRKKNLSNYLTKTDINKKKVPKESSCKGCKICKLINNDNTITNKAAGITKKTKSGGTCKSKGVIYSVNCKKCNLMYIGHTGDSLNIRFSKHKYDIKNRPKNNELAEHCHKDHDIDTDLEIYIIDYGITSLKYRKFLEDRWICKLQTMKPTGLNFECGQYVKEMYQCWTSVWNTM